MNNPYYLLYYKIYSSLDALNELLKNDIMEWSAMFFVTLFGGLNAFTLMAISELKSGRPILTNEVIGVGTMIVILLMNYFVFLNKKRYQKILEYYKGKDTFIGGVFVMFYVVISVVLFYHYGAKVRDLRMG